MFKLFSKFRNDNKLVFNPKDVFDGVLPYNSDRFKLFLKNIDNKKIPIFSLRDINKADKVFPYQLFTLIITFYFFNIGTTLFIHSLINSSNISSVIITSSEYLPNEFSIASLVDCSI